MLMSSVTWPLRVAQLSIPRAKVEMSSLWASWSFEALCPDLHERVGRNVALFEEEGRVLFAHQILLKFCPFVAKGIPVCGDWGYRIRRNLEVLG